VLAAAADHRGEQKQKDGFEARLHTTVNSRIADEKAIKVTGAT